MKYEIYSLKWWNDYQPPEEIIVCVSASDFFKFLNSVKHDGVDFGEAYEFHINGHVVAEFRNL